MFVCARTLENINKRNGHSFELPEAEQSYNYEKVHFLIVTYESIWYKEIFSIYFIYYK